LSRVPPHLRRLLESPLETFEKLEILTALVRASGHVLSAHELVTAVDLPIEVVAAALAELAAAGVVETSAGLARLAPKGPDLPAIRELVGFYEADRVAVARELSEQSMVRIRGMAARAFAVAFQPPKKPGDAR
jgi:hypothetical protein